MNCRSSGLTDRGMLRSVNQDNFFVDPDGRLFIVADGMGGHAGGQEASRIATEVLSEVILANWDSEESSDRLLSTAIHKANKAIIDDQDRHPERAEMGTTLVMVLFRDGQWWQAHVGDSRLYRSHSWQLQQLTRDHTWVARAVETGDLNPEQARTHPWRHVLMQCLGRHDLEMVEIYPLNLQSGDRLLLCSDGLTEELSDIELTYHLSQLRSTTELDPVAEQLVQSAKEHGGRDNITVVLVALDAEDADQDPEPEHEPSEGLSDATLAMGGP